MKTPRPSSDSRAPDLLTPASLAQRWGLSEKTLANWRASSQGPAFVKLGARVRYRLADVVAFESKPNPER